MHHVRCAKRGFPLPVPDPRPDRNKSESRNDSEDAGPAQTVQHEHSVTPVGAVREELSSSPRRRSKGTSALDDGQVSRSGSPGPAVSVDGLEYTYPGIGEDRTDRHAYQVGTHVENSLSTALPPTRYTHHQAVELSSSKLLSDPMIAGVVRAIHCTTLWQHVAAKASFIRLFFVSAQDPRSHRPATYRPHKHKRTTRV